MFCIQPPLTPTHTQCSCRVLTSSAEVLLHNRIECYLALLGPGCDRFSLRPLPPPQCFTCSTCRNRLVPGDRFHYINGSLFCEHDRPTALINGHLSSLQTNPLLPDQKVRPPPQPGRTRRVLRTKLKSQTLTARHQSGGLISRKRKISVIC